MDLKILVLAGGQGTRFWPLSRRSRPKQFLPFGNGEESLLQATVRRLRPLLKAQDISNQLFISTNQRLVDITLSHVPDATIIPEPEPKSTAPCIGLAALKLKQLDPEAVMVVVHADAAVADEAKMRAALLSTANLAEKEDVLVALGVAPRYAHTGYGYIEHGDTLHNGFSIRRFCEKPDRATAEMFIQDRRFLWNSGMFAWKVRVILEAFATYLPEFYQGLLEVEKVLGTSEERVCIERVFASAPSVAIDTAIMEKAQNTAVIAAEEFGWDDVGSWDVWAEYLPHDEDENVSIGEVVSIDAHGNIVHANKKPIVLLGVERMAIIDAGDALLVCPVDRLQEVKKVVDKIKANGRDDLL